MCADIHGRDKRDYAIIDRNIIDETGRIYESAM